MLLPRRIDFNIEDFFHDHFKKRRRWALPTGWVFHFGPFKVRFK